MATVPPPPYHGAVNYQGQPSGPPLQNYGYPIQQAYAHQGPNAVGFGQVPYPVNPPPVTTQPVVTPYGVVVEERAAPPVAVQGTAATPPHDESAHVDDLVHLQCIVFALWGQRL
ncbi:hypothetical protein Bbelb_081200 [Branchiostoma belcheri]|nr:hypothetical protein Bbelb_081200 [Branchiostoma belcheri]